MKVFIKLFVFLSICFGSQNSNADQVGNSDHLINEMRVIKIDPSEFDDEYSEAMNNDDLESINRAIFSFNMTVDDYFLAPIARGYRYLVHDWVRARVFDFFDNINEPINFANSVLQGDMEGAFRGFWRFVVNSTIGVGGIYDVAAGFGLKEREKSFSQTLAFYGIGSGHYLVLPLLGPSTVRDFGGFSVDRFADPTFAISSASGTVALIAGNVISTRESLLGLTDSLEEDAFDLYSSYKSAYLQNRKRNLINNL